MENRTLIRLNEHTESLVICDTCGNTIIFNECGFCADVNSANSKVRSTKPNFWEEVNGLILGWIILFVATALCIGIARLM